MRSRRFLGASRCISGEWHNRIQIITWMCWNLCSLLKNNKRLRVFLYLKDICLSHIHTTMTRYIFIIWWPKLSTNVDFLHHFNNFELDEFATKQIREWKIWKCFYTTSRLPYSKHHACITFNYNANKNFDFKFWLLKTFQNWHFRNCCTYLSDLLKQMLINLNYWNNCYIMLVSVLLL